MPAQNLKGFKILSEDDLMKLSLDRLDAYYAQLDQWEQEKTAAEKKKRDQARLRLVDRKRQEERHLFREKQAQRLAKDSEEDTVASIKRFKDDVDNFSRSATRKGNSAVGLKDDDIDQSGCIEPRLVFSCVEVPTISRPSGNGTSTPLHGPRPGSSLPLWKNDGKPLPYVAETEPGIAYHAMANSPKIYYLEDRSDPFTSEEIAADRAKASKHPNNPVHKFTVAKDGCIYYNSATWKPSRDRCTVCLRDRLHCWRRATSNFRGCLRCNYRKAKCESITEDKSESSEEEDDTPNVPSPTRKSTGTTKVTKRKRAQTDSEDDSDEEESVRRSQGRPKVSEETDIATKDCVSPVLSSFREMIKESARHHAALEGILLKAVEGICTQTMETRKAGTRR